MGCCSSSDQAQVRPQENKTPSCCLSPLKTSTTPTTATNSGTPTTASTSSTPTPMNDLYEMVTAAFVWWWGVNELVVHSGDGGSSGRSSGCSSTSSSVSGCRIGGSASGVSIKESHLLCCRRCSPNGSSSSRIREAVSKVRNNSCHGVAGIAQLVMVLDVMEVVCPKAAWLLSKPKGFKDGEGGEVKVVGEHKPLNSSLWYYSEDCDVRRHHNNSDGNQEWNVVDGEDDEVMSEETYDEEDGVMTEETCVEEGDVMTGEACEEEGEEVVSLLEQMRRSGADRIVVGAARRQVGMKWEYTTARGKEE
eukprot:GHVS01084305.1.p1 GENE.GHVS01084305.1~~GHVS01084305.1.p1  ORF type:complete len:306 (+),score=107.86 GHVS01084305.1:462-1379(+)